VKRRGQRVLENRLALAHFDAAWAASSVESFKAPR
jgi:hypothetical protein